MTTVRIMQTQHFRGQFKVLMRRPHGRPRGRGRRAWKVTDCATVQHTPWTYTADQAAFIAEVVADRKPLPAPPVEIT